MLLDVKVLKHSQVRAEGQLLIHDPDTQTARCCRRIGGKVYRQSLLSSSPAFGRVTPDITRVRVLLPAPFAPMRP